MAEVDLVLLTRGEPTGRGDPRVRVGPSVFLCDTYYLLLDPSSPEESDAKVRRVLGRLLDQWIAALPGAGRGVPLFLPFDFSDQHTRWLRVTLTGDVAEYAAGWSAIPGYALAPSAVGERSKDVPDWQAESPACRQPLRELIADLRRIRDREAGPG